jgi:DNA-binding XRE family transcriptional regulator
VNDNLKLNEHHLRIFHESRKRRFFVGELIYDQVKDRYELIYNKSYAYSKTAIPLGPDLSLFQLHHHSAKGELFKSFLDRIPDPENPAYVDYCEAQGISPAEKNPIVLLGSIGRRGPSSFIFEPVYDSLFHASTIKKWREELGITLHDLAAVLDINVTTLQRLESGVSHDSNTLKIVEIFLKFPQVALWQLKQTGGRLHSSVLVKLMRHFKEAVKNM